ncbi:hypothetical protein KSP39_PZI017886 [Platanthera zijinensis]|uniref:Exocyst subunit Exo70 family protein n=1 Tax=Platanthera zijinensis TaxID=2320716 RepID=A0AAP0B663_9ASPA
MNVNRSIENLIKLGRLTTLTAINLPQVFIISLVVLNLLIDSLFISFLKSSPDSLKSSAAPLDGGLLVAVLDKLEARDNTIAPSPLPVSVIARLQAILERMDANRRLDRCVAINVDVRCSNIQASLRSLNLYYLVITLAEFDHLQSIQVHIDKWAGHLEFTVNTHWYFCKNLKGTKPGELLGDTWLREHENYKDYYAAFFIRESCGKLPSLLSREFINHDGYEFIFLSRYHFCLQ